MRMMMKVQSPTIDGNRAIKDKSIGRILESAMADLKPEATYFTCQNGKRTAIFFFDMKNSSEMPKMGERFFLDLNAEIEFTPCMNPEELKAGLMQI